MLPLEQLTLYALQMLARAVKTEHPSLPGAPVVPHTLALVLWFIYAEKGTTHVPYVQSTYALDGFQPKAASLRVHTPLGNTAPKTKGSRRQQPRFPPPNQQLGLHRHCSSKQK